MPPLLKPLFLSENSDVFVVLSTMSVYEPKVIVIEHKKEMKGTNILTNNIMCNMPIL